jgi:hypothetical protein
MKRRGPLTRYGPQAESRVPGAIYHPLALRTACCIASGSLAEISHYQEPTPATDLRSSHMTISRHDRSHQLPFYDIYIILALAKNRLVLQHCRRET